jgi:CubicO group peptidase (beta-lactamase class C family)
MLIAIFTACPDKDDLGDDEIGNETDPEPFDPLDGAGNVPTGDPDLSMPWTSPSSLGNGLVHDTRHDVDSTPYSTNDGIPWSDFVESYTTMTAIGFRPAQIAAEVQLSGNGELEITDHTLYISDDDANYRTEIATHAFDTLDAERTFDDFAPSQLGARPTSIHTFSAGGKVGYSVAWVFDSASASPTVPWQMVSGRSERELGLLLATPGLRPISISSRLRAGRREYAAILIAHDEAWGEWPASVGLSGDSLAAFVEAKWADGFYPFRISTEHGDPTRLSVLWARRPPGISVQVRMNLDEEDFMAEDANWRSHGYHLETVDHYVDEGSERHAAVWVRYSPYLRWEGTQFAEDDDAYSTRYRMFHDQVVRHLGLATEVDCSGGQECPDGTSCHSCAQDVPCFHEGLCVEANFGDYLRPSGTLHIFEGEELVLNRAYTFAPAIYADTKINAPMKLASVSKSITATAVVRLMAAKDRPLSVPFAPQVKVFPAYPLKSPAGVAATVREVLHNWGGFASNSNAPESYKKHALIIESGIGTRPIDGQELLEYVFAPPPDGHVNLGELHEDNYWESSWLSDSRKTGAVLYSNVGYSMLGELVRIQAGQPYDEYVRQTLLAPLGLQSRIFPDGGNRFAACGPTLADQGGYLIDELHLYDTESPNPIDPLFGVAATPGVPDWVTNVGPVDPRAPTQAAYRYGGDVFLGGAPLAAGGWWGDGEALGILIRTISRTNLLLPNAKAAQLWHPQYWNFEPSLGAGWAYGLGWYIRGNWVAWAGGDQGSTALVLHNRMWDVTVVYLANASGGAFPDFINPLMQSPQLVQGGSRIGAVWPCVEDPSFAPLSACENLPVSAIY